MNENLSDRISIITLNQCEIASISGGMLGLLTFIVPAVDIACRLFGGVFAQRNEAEAIQIRQTVVLGTALFAGVTKFATALYNGMDLNDAKNSDYVVAAAIGAWLCFRVKLVLNNRI